MQQCKSPDVALGLQLTLYLIHHLLARLQDNKTLGGVHAMLRLSLHAILFERMPSSGLEGGSQK